MELEILHQTLSELKELKQGQAKLEQRQAKLEEDHAKLEQRQIRLETILENESRYDIGIVAENSLSLNQKFDELQGINERVLELKKDVDILKSITKDNMYDLQALKATQ